LIPDSAVFLKRIEALPLVTYQAGENVLTAGSRTGRLLILKSLPAGGVGRPGLSTPQQTLTATWNKRAPAGLSRIRQIIAVNLPLGLLVVGSSFAWPMLIARSGQSARRRTSNFHR
jgi:hypothetical protein